MFCFVYLSNDTATPLWVPKKKKKKALETRPLLMGDMVIPTFFLSTSKKQRAPAKAGARRLRMRKLQCAGELPESIAVSPKGSVYRRDDAFPSPFFSRRICYGDGNQGACVLRKPDSLHKNLRGFNERFFKSVLDTLAIFPRDCIYQDSQCPFLTRSGECGRVIVRSHSSCGRFRPLLRSGSEHESHK